MTGRIKRLVTHLQGVTHLHSASGRKHRIVPMSREDERIQAEINRRREERRRDRRTAHEERP